MEQLLPRAFVFQSFCRGLEMEALFVMSSLGGGKCERGLEKAEPVLQSQERFEGTESEKP